MEQNRQHFYELSLEYVCKLQEIQERKKFEFVEPVSINSKLLCELNAVIENRSLFLSRSHLQFLQAVMHKYETGCRKLCTERPGRCGVEIPPLSSGSRPYLCSSGMRIIPFATWPQGPCRQVQLLPS